MLLSVHRHFLSIPYQNSHLPLIRLSPNSKSSWQICCLGLSHFPKIAFHDFGNLPAVLVQLSVDFLCKAKSVEFSTAFSNSIRQGEVCISMVLLVNIYHWSRSSIKRCNHASIFLLDCLRSTRVVWIILWHLGVPLSPILRSSCRFDYPLCVLFLRHECLEKTAKPT